VDSTAAHWSSTAKDEKTLLKNWATLQDDFEKAAPNLGRRFTEVCSSHSDYIWDLSN
jgi:hypothetical protein